jgi:hypothetical protein
LGEPQLLGGDVLAVGDHLGGELFPVEEGLGVGHGVEEVGDVAGAGRHGGRHLLGSRLGVAEGDDHPALRRFADHAGGAGELGGEGEDACRRLREEPLEAVEVGRLEGIGVEGAGAPRVEEGALEVDRGGGGEGGGHEGGEEGGGAVAGVEVGQAGDGLGALGGVGAGAAVHVEVHEARRQEESVEVAALGALALAERFDAALLDRHPARVEQPATGGEHRGVADQLRQLGFPNDA